MLHEQAVPTNAVAAFETIIERRIAERTWGRIRDLRVEVTAERIVVRGWTSTYYVKQLAIQALLEETRTTMSFPVIDMEIVVDGECPRRLPANATSAVPRPLCRRS